mmetsp:Transcript_36803/g.113384  ORF Transcript_36803/g.113384 Transcript_36803/m.113384 type:complete len:318 (+) Transcript_36803:79-1032(+)
MAPKKRTRTEEKSETCLSNIGEDTLGAELDYIKLKLQSNPSLAFTLASLLRRDKLMGLLGKCNKDVKGEQEERLKAKVTKWKLLKEDHILRILRECEPSKFTAQCLQNDHVKHCLLGFLTFSLNVKCDGKLPLEEYPRMVIVSDLVRLCKMRYDMMGMRLKNEELESFQGYYKISDDDVTCKILPGKVAKLPFKNTDPEALIENGFVLDAKYTSKKQHCSLFLKELFEDMDDVALVEEDSPWNLPADAAAEPLPAAPATPPLADGEIAGSPSALAGLQTPPPRALTGLPPLSPSPPEAWPALAGIGGAMNRGPPPKA